MADVTPIYGLPYLELGDAPDIASGLEDLATEVETELARIDAAYQAKSGIIRVRKSADEGVTSSTTIQPDDHLLFAAAANQRYIVEAVIFVTVAGGNSSTDIKVGWSMPTGGSATFGGVGPDLAMPGTDSVGQGNYLGIIGAGTSMIPYGLYASGTTCIMVKGVISMSTTAGNVALGWAQNSSATQTVTVKAGSYLKAELI